LLAYFYLDPYGIYFSHIISRNGCRNINGAIIKYIGDLGRPLERVVAIDNRILPFAYNLNNLIPIKSWTPFQKDAGTDSGELLRCLDIVDAFHTSPFVSVTNYLTPIFELEIKLNHFQLQNILVGKTVVPLLKNNYDFNNMIKTWIQNRPSSISIRNDKLLIGPAAFHKNLTLVVDMDETLLHCGTETLPDAEFFYKDPSCMIRPKLKEFLIRASKDYELVLWSYGNIYQFNFRLR
jgi:hypothetical protein